MLLCNRGFSQTDDNLGKLAGDDIFINWVASVSNNELDVYLDIRTQLGENSNYFHQALLETKTNEDVESVFAKFGYDPENSDQKMAEHLVHGLYFKQERPEIWQLPEPDRLEVIKEAYYQGMNSSDPRWVELRNNLLNRVQAHCGSTGRIVPSEIAGCFWDALSDVVQIVGGFQVLITAVNNANWVAAIAAIKKILKTMGRRLGWFGLAITAFDIGLCLWEANET